MTDRADEQGISYASAGVDIEAGDRAVELFKPWAKKATRPEVRGGLGGFAGLFALRGDYREPLLYAAILAVLLGWRAWKGWWPRGAATPAPRQPHR